MKSTSEFVYTCGIDDKLREISIIDNCYTNFETQLGAQPRGMSLVDNTIVIVTTKQVSRVKSYEINQNAEHRAHIRFGFADYRI